MSVWYSPRTKRWTVEDPISYSTHLGVIVVPEGFETDLASVPRLLWAFVAPHDLGIEAAVVHDFLYQRNGHPRKEADRAFLAIMAELGVPAWRMFSAYLAVRWFGWMPWRGHRRRDG